MMRKDEGISSILFLRSSAGSGKTYNLSLRYIETLLKNGGNPSNIVAITFTNKAAKEMRERLLEIMKSIVLNIPLFGSNTDPLEEILPSSSKEKKEHARRIIEKGFESILRSYYDFKVGTIDSLVNLILKASVFKLGLPPDFEITQDFDICMDYVLYELIQKIFEEGKVKSMFDRFIESYLEVEGDDVSWYPKRNLREIVSLLWREETKENKVFEKHKEIEIDLIKKEIIKEIQKLREAVEKRPKIKFQTKFLKAIEKGDFESSCFEKEGIESSLIKGSEEPDEEVIVIWKRIKRHMESYYEAISLSKFLPYLELYELFKYGLQREINIKKRTVLIDQLNQLLQNIVSRSDFVPEIYYALSERYLHFLIDEFQDTNHLQWKNIEVLVEEALSKGGSLFIVGDTKQAIFRFRGGRSELLEEVTETYRRFNPEEKFLTSNYRSCEKIVYFNNIVFDPKNLEKLATFLLKQKERWEKMKGAYEFSYQEYKKRGGYVYGQVLQDEDHCIEKLKEIVSTIRAKGVFADGEIAILARKNQEVSKIVKVLLEMDIRVDSEVTINVLHNPLVREILHFLRFLEKPYDDMSFTGFVKGKIFEALSGIKSEEMMEWLEEKRMRDNILFYIHFRHEFKDIWDLHFEEIFKKVAFLPLYEVLILFFKKWRIFDLFPEDTCFFLHLLEMAKKMEDKGEHRLSDFLKSFDETKSEKENYQMLLKTTKLEDAIKVTNIHKAKGLQYPCVIIPFARLLPFSMQHSRDRSRFIIPSGEKLDLCYIKKEFVKYSEKLKDIYERKEEEAFLEELNVLYVAFTRAQKSLYMLFPKKNNLLIDYIFGLEPLSSYINDEVLQIGNESKEQEQGRGINQEEFLDSPSGVGPLRGIKSKIEAPEFFSIFNLLSKKKGEIIHYALSLIRSVEEGQDVLKIVEKCTEEATRKYGLSNLKTEIERNLKEFFQDEMIKRFFCMKEDDKVYTEREIVDKYGRTFKVDRINVKRDRIELVEFKTGETKKEEHKEQVLHYMHLLGEIYIGKPISSYIIYVDTREVIQVE